VLHRAEAPGRNIEQVPERGGAKSEMGRVRIQVLSKILKRASY